MSYWRCVDISLRFVGMHRRRGSCKIYIQVGIAFRQLAWNTFTKARTGEIPPFYNFILYSCKIRNELIFQEVVINKCTLPALIRSVTKLSVTPIFKPNLENLWL